MRYQRKNITETKDTCTNLLSTHKTISSKIESLTFYNW